MRKVYVDIKATLLLTMDEDEKWNAEKIETNLTKAIEGAQMLRGMPFIEVLDGVAIEVTDSK